MTTPVDRTLALLNALDDAAAARIDDLDPATMLGLGTLVGAGRNDPAWLYGQLGRASAVLDAIRSYVETGDVIVRDGVPDVLTEALRVAQVATDLTSPGPSA